MDEQDKPRQPSRRTMLQAGAASLLLTPAVATAAAATAVPASANATEFTATELPPARPVTLRVNGSEHTLQLDARTTLLDALREDLGLTGTKKGCDYGQCGACTVLVNGRRINACLTLSVMHEADEITTIEGLADGPLLHPMQAAFIARDGFQCGYCTSGQICAAVGMLAEVRAGWPSHASAAKPDEAVVLSEAEIRERMSGNLCRCAAYPNIVAAIRDAAQEF